MAHWKPLYISVGIIISLVVGAPLWWCFTRHSRKRIDILEDGEQDLRRLRRELDKMQGLELELQQSRSNFRLLQSERNDLSQQVTAHESQLLGYRECVTDLASARARFRLLELESTAKDEQHEIMVRDIQAAAESRATEADDKYANLLQKYEFINQMYRKLHDSAGQDQ